MNLFHKNSGAKRALMMRFSVLTVGVLFSCGTTTIEKYDGIMQEMYACHEDNGPLDSAALADALIGTHHWRYISSWGWGGPYQSDEAYEGYSIDLRANGTFTMNFGDTASTSGTWSLESSWATYRLELDPPCPTFYGQIYSCPPYTAFVSSPVDGPDHLYERQ